MDIIWDLIIVLQKWLLKNFDCLFEHEGIDTLKIAKTVHKDLPSRSLGALCGHYGIINSSAHRAYHDALATAAVSDTGTLF